MLRKLKLLRESTTAIESLTEEEIDAKFTLLSLAFRTDKFTLEQRLRRFRHQREVVEADTTAEVGNLQAFIHQLAESIFSVNEEEEGGGGSSPKMTLREWKATFDRLERQCSVVQSAIRKVASRSELYGAVRQEEKLSASFDVILLHLENLKRAKEKEAKELEDLKRLLSMSDKRCLPMSSSGMTGGLVQQLMMSSVGVRGGTQGDHDGGGGEGGDDRCGDSDDTGGSSEAMAKRRTFRSISGCPPNTKIVS